MAKRSKKALVVLGVLGVAGAGVALAMSGKRREDGAPPEESPEGESPEEQPPVGPPIQPEPSPVEGPDTTPGPQLAALQAEGLQASIARDTRRMREVASRMRAAGFNNDAALLEAAALAFETGAPPAPPATPTPTPDANDPDRLRAEAVAAMTRQDPAALRAVADRMAAAGMNEEADAMRAAAAAMGAAQRGELPPLTLPPGVVPVTAPPGEQGPEIIPPAPPPSASLPAPAPPPAPPLTPGPTPPFVPPPISDAPAPSPPRTPPVLVPTPIVAPRPAPPAPVPAPVPTTLEDDTAALLSDFLTRERTPAWKAASRGSATLKAWQRARGRTADGMFGVGDALRLAQETGLLPIIRFWPSSSGTNPRRALEDYRAQLGSLAASASEPRASQLRRAATRELGQSFGAASGLPGADDGQAPVRETISI